MSVRVLVADTDLMRRAIVFLLSDRDGITIIGEASTFLETVSKTTQLRPDVVVLGLNISDRDTPTDRAINTRIVATSIRIDDESKALAKSIGAVRLLDKMDLVQELIPAILELATVGGRPS